MGEKGEGAVNQFLVMIGFLSELQGHKSCRKSQMVGQVRKAVVKKMTSKKKRRRGHCSGMINLCRTRDC
jgi:hypothetical protein